MKRVRLSERDLFLLNMFNSSTSPCSLKAGEKSYNVSLASMKADTSSTFNKSQLYFYCFDVDCHNPPPKHQPAKVQMCAFYSSGPQLTHTLSLKSQRYSVACVNVSVTTHFTWGVLSADIVSTESDRHGSTRGEERGEEHV